MKDTELALLNASTELTNLVEVLEEAITQRHALHQVEWNLFRALLRLGGRLLVDFLERKGSGDCGPEISLKDGSVLSRGDVKARSYRSIFGDIQIKRYVYGQGQQVHAPLDAELNLPEWKYSYLLQEWGLCLSTQEAFGEVQKILDRILETDLSVRSQERLSRKVAEEVTSFRQAQPAPTTDEEAALLVAAVDCKGVPLTRKPEESARPSHRRKKGEKANKKKMACVGAVYTIEPFVRTPEDILDEVQRKARAPHRPSPKNKRVCADLVEDKEATFIQLAHQVHQRQTQDPKPVIFLGDGEKRLWKLQEKHLPEAVGVLDLWHGMEYLWKAANQFHKEGSPQAEDFVTARLGMLLDGKVGYVIGGLKQMMTKHRLKGSKKKVLQEVTTYFHNNRPRMRYDEYIAAGYPIGSGVAEGACRHLVKDRLERTGMRWTPEGAQAILDLRSTYLNEDWEDFWRHFTAAEKKRLYGSLNSKNFQAYKATA